MNAMPPRIEQINEPKPARQSAASWVAEHIVLPCVVAFGAGVLVALHFIPSPADLACDDAAHVAAHQAVAMGVQ